MSELILEREDEIGDTLYHKKNLVIGKLNNQLVDKLKMEDLDVVISGKTIIKAYIDHGVSKSILTKLPAQLQNPQSVFKSDTHDPEENILLLSFKTSRGLPIVMPIRQGVVVDRTRVSIMTSIYPKDNRNIVNAWKAKGLMLWENVEAIAENEKNRKEQEARKNKRFPILRIKRK